MEIVVKGSLAELATPLLVVGLFEDALAVRRGRGRGRRGDGRPARAPARRPASCAASPARSSSSTIPCRAAPGGARGRGGPRHPAASRPRASGGRRGGRRKARDLHVDRTPRCCTALARAAWTRGGRRGAGRGHPAGAVPLRPVQARARGRRPPGRAGHVVERDAERVDAIRAGVAAGTAMAEATITARDLAQGPANIVTATYLARAGPGGPPSDGLRVRSLRHGRAGARCGMNGLLAVNQGSAEPPELRGMRYTAPGAKTLAVVGKGITFDTGGISIKPAEGHALHAPRQVGRGGGDRLHAGGRRLQLPVQRARRLRRHRQHAQRHGLQARRRDSAYAAARRSRSSTPTPRAA